MGDYVTSVPRIPVAGVYIKAVENSVENVEKLPLKRGFSTKNGVWITNFDRNRQDFLKRAFCQPHLFRRSLTSLPAKRTR